MRTLTGGGRQFRWFALAAVLVIGAHLLLPSGAKPFTFVVASAMASVPLVLTLPGRPRGQRLPWQLMGSALVAVTVGNTLIVVGGTAFQVPAQKIISVGHALLLGAAVILVWRRGRNDLGGLIDVSIAAIGMGGLLWTSLLYPRLHELHAARRDQVAVLVSVLVLMGVLAALARIRFVADRRLPALDLMVVALLLSLIANIMLALTIGSMTATRPEWAQVMAMATFVCVGAVPLHPSANDVVRPGPTPVDRLTVGRLIFLGAALAVGPVVGGIRQMLDLSVEATLLAVSSLLISPLVMVRVGRLARQWRAAETALLHQATHDTLTGLANRAELLTRLEAALARDRAGGQTRVVLLFCDLNGFKAINDRLGHAAGDELLIGVATRLTAALRAGDTVARYGGDEFLVLCESPAQEEAVQRMSTGIREALDPPFTLAGEDVRISASIGAVTSRGDSHADDLITRADERMYRDKQQRDERQRGVPDPGPALQTVGGAARSA